MKKITLILIWALTCFNVARSQETPETESKKGDVVLEMTDGSTIRGWNRTNFKNDIKSIKITTIDGENISYEKDEVKKVIISDTIEYVKVGIIPYLLKKTPSADKWARVIYKGNGINIYSQYFERQRAYNQTHSYQQVKVYDYFIQIGDDPAMMVTSEYTSGKVANLKATNRKQLEYYFKKKYPQYAEFAQRIKNKEFETEGAPIEVVKAWEKEYAGK